MVAILGVAVVFGYRLVFLLMQQQHTTQQIIPQIVTTPIMPTIRPTIRPRTSTMINVCVNDGILLRTGRHADYYSTYILKQKSDLKTTCTIPHSKEISVSVYMQSQNLVSMILYNNQVPILEHIRPMSSKWLQFSTPIPRFLQNCNRLSVPIQETSSNHIEVEDDGCLNLYGKERRLTML